MFDAQTSVGDGNQEPSWREAGRKSGIVHLGVGAFHKAHQAVYTDDAIGASGGDWMITGVSLRSPDVADALNPQEGLYTLLTRGEDGVSARIIGSIRHVLVAPRERQAVLDAMTAEETKIVSLTITEKGYGIDAASGGLDEGHPSIAADLSNPAEPQSAIGFIVEALRLRKERDVGGFTVLCCDNLPSNGHVVQRLVRDFVQRVRPELQEFIDEYVTFPSTMVDRITPASTEQTFADVKRLTGRDDRAAVETEPFSQWVIEDKFVAGRPDWEAGGAIFADDVLPYEKMKLRMLNGSHSLLAYSGFIAGHVYVRDVMQDAALVAVIRNHMNAIAQTLDPVAGISFDDYAGQLLTRFSNPSIAHQTYQIAMDGTQKLPQRLLEPAIFALAKGDPLDSYAFAVAAWMRYCLGMNENGAKYDLRDPREAEIEALLAGTESDAGSIVDRLMSLPGLFPDELSTSSEWKRAVAQRLEIMLSKSMRAAIEAEAKSAA
ncbi:mannitol dehydrogenase family protein [Aquamicrobium zhengzhouense]|uniref:Mannitol dehydrogenase family protein n=1 Tax=Aquamicrobium zhengzhouense TaxID=2781738 RepID=A0ABS0SIC7_9HYPH|nr:mannitol dehydrogenase family protein [Aquamicrobium zhengzhouense]MBI1622511.1 mannitol dehydrogenase family protein [Aquamicrobium zhengzhouense]